MVRKRLLSDVQHDFVVERYIRGDVMKDIAYELGVSVDVVRLVLLRRMVSRRLSRPLYCKNASFEVMPY